MESTIWNRWNFCFRAILRDIILPVNPRIRPNSSWDSCPGYILLPDRKHFQFHSLSTWLLYFLIYLINVHFTVGLLISSRIKQRELVRLYSGIKGGWVWGIWRNHRDCFTFNSLFECNRAISPKRPVDIMLTLVITTKSQTTCYKLIYNQAINKSLK